MSRNKKIVVVIIALMLVLVGVSMVIYPKFATEYARTVKSGILTEYEAEIEATASAELDELRAAAHSYNHDLYSGVFSWMEAEANGYFDQLNLNGSGIMGYINIPKINVNLPIYHGTSPEELAKGAGHMSQTSLPVGGENTHSAISAHSGMATDVMFSDLGLLELGDIFHLIVLGETLTYEVDDIMEVLPTEISTIKIIPGEDLCTLITCTPIGVNSHRLLVRGHRIETPIEDAEGSEATVPTETESGSEESIWEKHYRDSVMNSLKLSGILLVPIVIIFLLLYRKRKEQNAPAQNSEQNTEGDTDA